MVARWCWVVVASSGCLQDPCKERIIPLDEGDVSLNGEVLSDLIAEAEVPVEVVGVNTAGDEVVVRVELVVDRSRIRAVDLEHRGYGMFPRYEVGATCGDGVMAPADYLVWADGDPVLEGVGWANFRAAEAWVAALGGSQVSGDRVAWLGDPPPAYEGEGEVTSEGVSFRMEHGGPAPVGAVQWSRDVAGPLADVPLLSWPAPALEGT